MARQLTITIDVNGTAAAGIPAIIGNLQQLGVAGGQASAGMNSAAQGATNAGNAAATASGKMMTLQQQIDLNRRNAYALTIGGYQLKAMGDALVGTLQSLVAGFTDYDFAVRRAAGAMNILKENTGLVNELKQSVTDLSIATKGFSPEEIGRGYYYWGSTTGVVVKSSGDLLRVQEQLLPVMKMAAMTETDYEQAIKGVVGVLQQFNRPMQDATLVTEEMFTVAQKTAIEIPNLIESFKMVGPVAAGFGVSIEDMLKTLGELGNAGIRGSMAGRALAMMFAKIAEPTAKATELLDKYVVSAGLAAEGTSFADVIFPEGKFIGIQGYLNTLSRMMEDMTQKEKQHFLAAITTQNEWRALAPLLDANTRSLKEYGKGVVEMSKSMDGAAETFANSWELMAQSAKFAFKEFENQIASFTNVLAEAVVVAVRPLMEAIGGLAESIGEFARANPIIMQFIGLIIAGAGAFMSITGALVTFLGGLMLLTHTVLPSIMMTFGMATESAIVTMGTFAKLGTIFKWLGTTVLSFINIGLGPLLAVIAAVIVAAGAITAVIQDNAAQLGRFGDAIGTLFGDILNVIGLVVGILFTLGQAIGHLISGPIGALIDILTAVVNVFDWMVKGAAAIIDGVVKAFQMLADALGDVNDWLNANGWGVLEGVLRGVNDGLGEAVRLLHEFLSLLGSLPQGPGAGGGLNVAGPGGSVNVSAPQFGAMAQAGFNLSIPKAISDQEYLSTKTAREELEKYKAAQDDARESAAQTSVVMAAQNRVLQEQAKELATNGQGWIDWTTNVVNALVDSSGVMAEQVVKWIENISSTNKAWRESAYKGITQYVSGMIEKGGMEIPPAVKQVYTIATNMMKSENPKVRTEGGKMIAILAQGFKDGNVSAVMPVVGKMMQDVIKQINGTNPAARKEGFNTIAAVAAGIRESKWASDEMKNQMANILAVLRDPSASQDAKAAAAAVVAAYMSTMSQIGPYIDTVVKVMTNPFKYAYLIPQLAKMSGSIAKSMSVIGGGAGAPAAPKGAGPSGGSGGGGTEKSPLEKALEVAKNAVDLAEALDKLDGVNVKKMVQKTMKPIAEAMLLADQITYNVTKSFGKEKLQKVAEFADATGKVVSMLNTAFDAFAKAKDYKEVSKKVLQSVVTGVKYLVQMVEDAAKAFKAKGLAAATVFSEAAGKVLDMLGKAFDAFDKAPKELILQTPKFFEDVAAQIELAVKAMESAAVRANQELLPKTEAFSKTAEAVMGALEKAFGIFGKKIEFVAPSEDDLQKVIDAIATSIDKMKTAMEDFIAKNGTEILATIDKFAQTGSVVMDAIAKAFEVFTPKVVKGPDAAAGEYMGASPLDDLEKWIYTLRHSIESIKAQIDQMDPNIDYDKIQKVAETASKIVEAIDAFFQLAGKKDSETSGETLQSLIQTNLDTIMDLVSKFIVKFKDVGSSFVGYFIEGMMSMRESLLKAVNEINSLIMTGLQGQATLNISWSGSAGDQSASGSDTTTTPAPGMAGGGPVLPGHTYTVGENGRETLVMGQSGGYIHSASATAANMSLSSMSGSLNVNVNVTSSDNSVTAVSQTELANAISNALAGSLRNSAAVV